MACANAVAVAAAQQRLGHTAYGVLFIAYCVLLTAYCL